MDEKPINSLQRFCFFLLSLGFVLTMGMGFLVLIYYSAHQSSNTLNICGRIFIACAIFFGLLMMLITITHFCEKCQNKRNIIVQFNNELPILNYQKAPFNYFSIDDDEEEIIVNNVKNNKKKTNDNISIKSDESHLIMTPF
jgi:hypothetical protein